MDLNTHGANAYLVCKCTGVCSVEELLADVDTATGAFNLLSLVVLGHVEVVYSFNETGSTKN